MNIIQRLLASLILFSLLVTACGKDEITPEGIVGKWTEVEPAELIQFAGTGHEITFYSNGTFDLELTLWTDMIVLGDSCPGNRMDYIQGDYALDGDMISLDGTYVDASYDNSMPNCAGLSNYNVEYRYSFSDDILILNTDASIQDQIHLIR